jgi:hypothetical protein
MKLRFLGVFVFVNVLSAGIFLTQARAQEDSATASISAQSSMLSAVETAKIFPATVFFRGQTASVQGRNSGGVRFADKSLMMVSLVDTSGYSSQVQQKYQAYFITETTLEMDGHTLAPGAYGCGFVGDNFLVMDIGGHDLFSAHSTKDTELRRPTPLQVIAAAGGYRLYAGRNYVAFRPASER